MRIKYLFPIILFLFMLVSSSHGLMLIAGNTASTGGASCSSDSFTDSDSTALATHDSNWTQVNATYPIANLEINSNLCEPTGEYVLASAYYDDATCGTGDAYSKGTTWDKDDGSRTMNICTRMSADHLGYCADLSLPSAGEWTRLTFYRDGTQISYQDGFTLPQNTTYTIYLKAVTNGSQVDLSAWIDSTAGAADATYSDTNAARLLTGCSGIESRTSSSYVPTIDDWSNCPW